ncbi:NRPS-like enzyme [Apiospora saccharicola]|uniref:NRPS-like enzyme n=1 Tax=Apiospora saccharicola TaxID=335842 RepID=A0ABR1U6C0_9PEZI
MEFGKRLLPQVVDHYAIADPGRLYGLVPKSASSLEHGYSSITMAKLAAMVNRLCRWLENALGIGDLNTITYIGPADPRYAVFYLAAIKCRYKVLLISPRNRVSQNQSMLARTHCKALFYASEVSEVVKPLEQQASSGDVPALFCPVPSLEELLHTTEDTETYPFEKTFEELRDEPCLILHSSGSTGDPKLVTLTHGTFSVTDIDRHMPVPEGRHAQNGDMFNFKGGGRFYSCFPPYHLAGVHAYIDLPIFSSSATVVFGPGNMPPSGHLLKEILKYQDVCAFYVPPVIIEQWAAEPLASEQAKKLRFVLFGGGPLSPRIGNWLSQVTNVCQMYGSLELGQIQLLVPKPDRWGYLELNPFEEADMQLVEEEEQTYEMVLHQGNPRVDAHRSLSHNFPSVKTWRTGDLFVQHPTEAGLWRFHSRVDDLIVLSSSHKIRPLAMETMIQGHPLLSGALVVGQGRPEPLLVVEPSPQTYLDTAIATDSQAFIDVIWPAVDEANMIAPTYAHIDRSMIIVARHDTPFIRAPKGTVVRKLTVQAYAADIEAAYADGEDHLVSGHAIDSKTPTALPSREIDAYLLPAFKEFLRKHVQRNLSNKDVVFEDSDDLFLKGLDSLGCLRLSKSINDGLMGRGKSTRSASPVLRLLYQYPAIDKLAPVLLGLLFHHRVPNFHDTTFESRESLERVVSEFTKDLPVPTKNDTASDQAMPHPAKLNVAILGSRGSLGPNIIKELQANPRVAKVYCLARGNSLGLGPELHMSDSSRLTFMPVDLSKPRLGLSEKDYTELQHNAQVLIHNAWKVDFKWTLDSYGPQYLRSVRQLVDLVAGSPLRPQPRLVFISSTSSVQQWGSEETDHPLGVDGNRKMSPVAEEVPEESTDASFFLGYGRSKHAAERILALASRLSRTPVTIVRSGQMAGTMATTPQTGSTAVWPETDWVPLLARISAALGKIPRDLPAMDWTPVNLTAQVICELAGLVAEEKSSTRRDLLEVFNVVNPRPAEWADFVAEFQCLRGEEKRVSEVSMEEWVQCLMNSDFQGVPEADTASFVGVYPFFDYLAKMIARGAGLQLPFNTSGAVEASKTLANMPPIDRTMLRMWFQQWNV